jgi:hypothetical protein
VTRGDARRRALDIVARLSDLNARFTQGALSWRGYTAARAAITDEMAAALECAESAGVEA